MNDRTKGLFFDHITESRMVGWIEREHTSCLRFPSGNRLPHDLQDRFLKASQRTGYEFSVTTFQVRRTDALWRVSVTITNSGVAPFYYSWPFQLAVLEDGAAVKTRSTPWDATRILPGEGAVVYETTLDAGELPSSGGTLLLRIPNPLPNGPPIRFANKEQDIDVDEWLSLKSHGEGK